MSFVKKLSLPLLLVLVLVVLFLVIQPRIQNMLFAEQRQQELNKLVQQTKEQKRLDLASYWQFREFYSPGAFEYEKAGFDGNKHPIVGDFKQLDKAATPVLFFASKRITSIGGQTRTRILSVKPNANEQVIVSSPSVAVIEDQEQITIMFLEPTIEVKKVNGFFQYQLPLAEKLGSMWFEVTKIKKD